MNLWPKISGLFHKEKLDADMAEEMRLHVERRTEENIASGMSAADAHFAAQRKFGGVEQVKETAREQRGLLWLEQVVQDVTYALRQFGRARGFTAVVVLTLALGIGSITAIYSVVDAVFLHPIPGEYPERVVQIGEWHQFRNMRAPTRAGLSPPPVEALQANQDFFAELTWCNELQLERKGDDFATTAHGSMVSANFFSFFGVQPLLGRTFAANEAVAVELGKPVRDTTIVLSHAWWKSAFSGDREIIGREIELGDRRFTVVGVMPDFFQFPGGSFWVPAEPDRPQPRWVQAANLKFLARLKPEQTVANAQAMVDSLALRLMQDYPENDRHYGGSWRESKTGLRLWVQPLRESIQNPTYTPTLYYDQMRRTLFGFLGAIGFVLAIVCVNVANLTLARTERRQHELSIRAALGAGRGRLMRQLLTENLLLALFGGASGLLVANWGIKLLAAFNQMPQLRPIELDGRVLVIALVASLLTGLIFGLLPAWRAGRSSENLKQSGATTTSDVRGGTYRHALVIAEVALAVVLLTGAGLMIQSVVKLLHVDPGYDAAKIIQVRLSLLGSSAPRTALARDALVMRSQERIAALPGVSSVGIFKNGSREEKILPDGRAEPLMLTGAQVGWERSDYFQALRLPLLRGRYFEAGDVGEEKRTVIVNETLAQLCWPGENPIGKKLRAVERKDEPSYEVIGLVGDARIFRLDEMLKPIFFRPYGNAALGGAADTLLVRTAVEPGVLVSSIRAALKSESDSMRMPGITLTQQAFYNSTQGHRVFRNYLVAFAGIGLLLAALGIYGVLAYAVARRTREIGVRIAIGAERRHVIRMIMSQGTRLIGGGVLVGLLAAFWITKFLEGQLFGVSRYDPVVLALVVAGLTTVALLACWLPARRAAKVDPIVALRSE